MPLIGNLSPGHMVLMWRKTKKEINVNLNRFPSYCLEHSSAKRPLVSSAEDVLAIRGVETKCGKMTTVRRSESLFVIHREMRRRLGYQRVEHMATT